MSKFKPVNNKENFPEVEDKVLKFWKKRNIFEKSVEQRPESENYVFYDGPPFITGTPHYGTLLSRIAKDVVPRYWAMNGKRVERQWGWDAHGLPIENKVENKLGLKNRRDIEKIGILEFIKSCYEYTEETSADWEWYKDKIGQWVDFENAYFTMSQDSMESVIWVFKELWDKQKIYEGVRVSLYCTRCGTPISNFEIAMDNSYEIMNDPAVTIKFPLKDEANTYVLAWTTTPWTLPSNRALVVDKEADYVKVKRTVEVKKKQTVRAVFINGAKTALTIYGRDNHYSLPGGSINEGETAEEALMREMEEETGYKDLKVVRKLGTHVNQFLLQNDKILEEHAEVFLVEMNSKERVSPKFEKKEREYSKLGFEWVETDKAKKLLEIVGLEYKFIENAENETSSDEVGEVISEDSFDEHIILAKERAQDVFHIYDDETAKYEIVEEFKGEELVGKSYTPIYEFFEGNENDFKIYHFDGMANAHEGVGVVHSAPGFGEIDTQMGEYYGLTMMFSVDDEGKYIDKVTKWAGMYIKDADPYIIEELTNRKLLFHSARIDHRYPYCYRCHTPLIHKAQSQWYIDIQNMKDKMLKNNEEINWIPDHIKEGRFKKGIESAPDWGISRTRYWATPMPVWRDAEAEKDPETIVIGSRDELRDMTNEPITKLYLINPAISEDGESSHLTDDGWLQAREIEKKFESKVDILISADLDACKDTLTPITEGNDKLSITVNNVFGDESSHMKMLELAAKLLKNEDVERIADLSEEVIEGNSNELEEALKIEILKLLKENAGKAIAICAPDYVLSLIRSTFQKVSRRVAFRTGPEKGQWKEIFFDGEVELDLHRPFIDKFTITSKETGKTLTRVEDVLDVWMDSGSMPYAMKHYPFEDKSKFENSFPADFIAEYIAQTRAWFYVMHVLSTALFDKNSFKNVVVTGVMAGNDGRKMSKSYGNYPDPKETILKYGADPLRLYFMGSRIMVAEDIAINEEAIKDQIKTIILPLWNSYSFFVTYANQHGFEPGPELVHNVEKSEDNFEVPFEPKDKLNIWIISKLQMTIQNIRASFEEYNVPKAVKEIPEFLGILSKWYIRRSRDKFSEGDEEFMKTLYYVLVELIKLMAPVAPFVTEEIYENLVKENHERAKESIHLTDYPDDDFRFVQTHESVMAKMEIVREIVSLGQSIRVAEGIKVRQPLSEIEVKYDLDPDRDIELEQWMKDLISDELNIKVVDEDRNPDSGENWVTAEGENWGLKVSINTEITESLKREGVLRELQRGIQSMRKRAGLNIEDHANIRIRTGSKLVNEIIALQMDELKESVKAETIEVVNEVPENKVIKVEDEPVDIEVIT